MTTIDERRGIAAKLRNCEGGSEYNPVCLLAKIFDAGCVRVEGAGCEDCFGRIAPKIADLVEPCDRDALLELADEFDAMAEASIAAVFYRGDLFGFASRIREAADATPSR